MTPTERRENATLVRYRAVQREIIAALGMEGLRPLLASDPALGEIAFQCTRRHAQSLADLHRLRTALMGRQSRGGADHG